MKRKDFIVVWALMAAFALTAVAGAELAPTPPLGWNSFNSYGVYLHEEAAYANLESMAKKLKPHGYEFFVIDNGWFGEYALQEGTIFPAEKHAHDIRINEYGHFLPSKVYFPNGLKPIADRCHELGLKFGVHLMRGIPRKAYEQDLPIKGTKYTARDIADTDPKENCKWCTYCYGVDMTKPGAQEWYDGLIQHIADLGVDLIKYDDIVPHPDEVEAVAKAIEKTGKPIVLSLSPGNFVDPDAIDFFRQANMLRVTQDVWDEQHYIDDCFDAWRKWQGKEQPGFWIDMDMIPFGQLQLMSPPSKDAKKTPMDKGDIALAGKGVHRQCMLTRPQMETFITMRALAASPLMMGGDLPSLDDFSLSLITNHEMLACNQNGVMGSLMLEANGLETWKADKRGTTGEGWIGLFNRTEKETRFEVSPEILSLDGTDYSLTDVWGDRKVVCGQQVQLQPNGVLFIKYLQTKARTCQRVELKLLEGECWWGGLSSLGHEMPYDASSTVSHDLWGDNKGNQAQPLLLSSKGRYVWSESPLKYAFDTGTLTVTVREGELVSGTAGKNLRTAYAYAVKNFFPPDGRIPAPEMFTHPQYNTWIELMYDQNEQDILTYARAIIDQGFPPGVIMIDDNWQEDYGTWEFSSRRFQNPKKMMRELHDMGFKVMVWICPFVSADSAVFRELAAEGMLLLDPQKTQKILWANTKNKAAIIRWWNGASACLDLSNPKTQGWFKGRLDHLVNEYGVDGFKFDAGDARFYADGVVSFKPGTPNDHTTRFAEVGLAYPLNEYRASWKMAGLPLAQRLRDKRHRWPDLEKLVPDLMSQSLMGYAYTCPDLIGGGEYQSFLHGAVIDEEMIVRSAQVHALMPMMQFSVAPWRVLSKENSEICRQFALLHTRMGDTFLRLAREASKTGEPIVKPMALAWPDVGYERIDDQFMLGDDILVAPVVGKGARSRMVVFPEGRWKGDDGSVVEGGKTIEIQVPLARLPYFERVRK